MTLLYFEDAEVGTTCKAGPYLVSKEEIIQFAKQYDPVPRHIDEEAAARSLFGGLTASGVHTFAVFISLTIAVDRLADKVLDYCMSSPSVTLMDVIETKIGPAK